MRQLGLALSLLGTAPTSWAEVVRIEVLSRTPFAEGLAFGTVGAYEKVSGRLHHAVDPEHSANARIIDLKLARWSGSFFAFAPTQFQTRPS